MLTCVNTETLRLHSSRNFASIPNCPIPPRRCGRQGGGEGDLRRHRDSDRSADLYHQTEVCLDSRQPHG